MEAKALMCIGRYGHCIGCLVAGFVGRRGLEVWLEIDREREKLQSCTGIESEQPDLWWRDGPGHGDQQN